jgi:hypothetical protein
MDGHAARPRAVRASPPDGAEPLEQIGEAAVITPAPRALKDAA